MKFFSLLTLAFGLAWNLSAATVWLDDLNLAVATQEWSNPHKNQSVDGNALAIGGKEFEHGFGTHAHCTLKIILNGGAQKFSASVGVDDEVNKNPASSVEFIVLGDGKIFWRSGVMRAGSPAKDFTVDLTGVKPLVLEVSDAGDGNNYDHADWADAKFETTADTTAAIASEPFGPATPPYILTPPAPATPRINGADVFGVRPGSPFMFTIPATGDRPMEFSVKNIPDNFIITTNRNIDIQGIFKGVLFLNPTNGQMTGWVSDKGEYKIVLVAKNSKGEARKNFRIVVGDQIALTPPMGWNSWNCFAGAVSEEKVKSAADAMVKSGLINHGWTYINVDDFWQNNRESKDPALRGPFRDTNGVIVPNARFPDMKGLADYIHGLGLKAGLYSSPGPWTCGGCAASWQHEAQDAQTYAKWGFDYLKYDWCSYNDIASGNLSATNIPLGKESYRHPRAQFIPSRSWANFCGSSIATSFSAFANTAWRMWKNGAAKSAVIPGA